MNIHSPVAPFGQSQQAPSIILLFWFGWACSPQVQTSQVTADTKKPLVNIEITTHFIPATEVSYKMALIPGGEFSMGSADSESNRDEDEGPQNKVQVDSYWMGVHEVSFQEYQVFREKDLDKPVPGQEETWNADAISRPSPPYEDPTFGMGNVGFPAVSMTQFAALQYCKWLSNKSGTFYRLPTEAEWEYACRAGTTSAFYFGDDSGLADDFVWHMGNSEEVYHKVGTKSPNPWGLYDVHGNVSEWTMDQYDAGYYQELADEAIEHRNPWAKPTRLHPRTVRGGSWDDPIDDHRCAARTKSSLKWKERDPQIPKSFWWNTDSPFVGFRIVSPYKQPTQEEKDAFWTLVLGD